MLYLTTRDNKDAYTVHKTMMQDLAPDGGMFVPFQIPVLTDREITALADRSYGENIAEILNRFFSARLNGWSIDTAIGRNCIKTQTLTQKVSVVEQWHNPENSYSYVVNSLYSLLSSSEEIAKQPTNWVMVVIKIAILFAAYADMIKTGSLRFNESFDVAVNTNDFTDPISVWYASRMGLPVKMILCACDESDGVWDLIHRGQINTTALSNELKSGLERLVFSVYGLDETDRFIKTCEAGRLFAVNPEIDVNLNDTFFCAVMGQGRADAVINSLKRTDQYVVCADAALSYAAVQDYRAKTGENRLTLLFSDTNPV